MPHLLSFIMIISLSSSAEPPEVVLLDMPEATGLPPAAPPEIPRAGAPENLDLIIRMLSAWHPEDLPGQDSWAMQTDAAPALIWLANHGPLNYHRQRALAALRFFPSEPSKQILLKTALDLSQHAIVRMGAAQGLLGQQLSAQECKSIATTDGISSEGVVRAFHTVVASKSCQ